MSDFNAKEECFDILDENDFDAVILVTISANGKIEFAIQIRKDSDSPAAHKVIHAIHQVLVAGGVANKLVI